MASQQEHLSEPILPPFFPASLHMHNQLNNGSTIIPDFLPSSEFVGPETLPDYLPSHLPALIATALKWTGFFHDPPDYECRLTLDEHALAANLTYHSYREWLMALYDFFSLPFERSARRKQRLMDGQSILLSHLSHFTYLLHATAARREQFYYTRPQK